MLVRKLATIQHEDPIRALFENVRCLPPDPDDNGSSGRIQLADGWRPRWHMESGRPRASVRI